MLPMFNEPKMYMVTVKDSEMSRKGYPIPERDVRCNPFASYAFFSSNNS